MASGARLRSDNEAFGRAGSGTAFLITAQPPEQVVYTRVPASWGEFNTGLNQVPTDLCQDRNPPDPTPGPDRPDLGNYTYRSRLDIVTQCNIPLFTPGYQMRVIIKAGQPDEEILDYDLTLNGYPWRDFSDYDPAQPWAANRVDCEAVLPVSTVLPRGAGQRGPFSAYSPVSPYFGFPHFFTIYAWDLTRLPGVFSDPVALDIRLQDPEAITLIDTPSPNKNRATCAVAHSLACGSAVRIFDADTPPTERTVRIEAVTDTTFTWDYRFYGGAWNGLAEAQWSPSYNASIEHHTRCP